MGVEPACDHGRRKKRGSEPLGHAADIGVFGGVRGPLKFLTITTILAVMEQSIRVLCSNLKVLGLGLKISRINEYFDIFSPRCHDRGFILINVVAIFKVFPDPWTFAGLFRFLFFTKISDLNESESRLLPFSEYNVAKFSIFFYCMHLMFSLYSSLNVKIKFLSHVVFEILAKCNGKNTTSCFIIVFKV